MSADVQPLIGGRYAVQRELGRGGMAVVYEVYDQQAARSCALKRLHRTPDAKKQARTAELFEYEFHQLAELAHPHVVQVYEFAIDADGPYYTMELLDGGDLQQLAPLDWRRACAAARDICSALSLLHSRQLVHRDVSPRNVRCSPGGSAKLIDFGAVTPFGANKLIVGTPACCAPEVVGTQLLDARTDLYALGATLYYVLTGQHAYYARHFAQLAELWREPLPLPAAPEAEIPEALQALVMNLLRLDPDARPASAAEVMQRLHAIDGTVIDESLPFARAYLATPTLVGRAKALARVRARLKSALSGEGSVIAIEGASGTGRSRMLDACALRATLLGLTVVRISADHAQTGDWGVARSIAAQLLKVLPDATLAAARPVLDVLGHALPELSARVPECALRAISSELLRPQLQQALREWLAALSALSADKPLVIAVDDLERADEPSATWLALLACEQPARSLVLMATLEIDAASVSQAACKLFSEHSKRLLLRALSPSDTEQLLNALFGGAPNVEGWAHRLWTLSEGNPRQIMRLAQHLVDSGSVRYQAGAWVLPPALDAAELPLSASQAQRARVAALSEPSRKLASRLSLCPDLAFSPEECGRLLELDADGGGLVALREELQRAEIVRTLHDERLVLAHPTWVAILRAAQSPEACARGRVCLSEVLAARGDQDFRVGHLLLLAGEIDRGLDVLVQHAHRSQEQTALSEGLFLDYVRSLPCDWQQVFHDAVRLCRERGRPRSERYALLSRLAGILAMHGLEDKPHFDELLSELACDSGMTDWAALDPSLEPMPRLTKALEQAQARYDQAPPEWRNLDPLNAIKQLARAAISAMPMAAATMDVKVVRALPSLVPLIPLSPALGSIDLLTQGMIARYSGRYERAAACYRQVLERLRQPDRGGFDASHSGYMILGVMNGLGMLEAGMGREISLQLAEELEREPTHRVNGLQVRMLYQLWQGNSVEAERHKRLVDRVRIENSARHWFEGSHLLWELHAHAICEDVTRLKQDREELAPLAQRYPTWQAVARYAAAQLHHACADEPAALREIEQALTLTAAGEHPSWAQIAATHLRILLRLGRAEEASQLAMRYLAEAAAAELDYQTEYLRLSQALVHATRAEAADAVSCADAAIVNLSKAGIGGLNLAWAYETRARVAALLGDAASTQRYSGLSAGIYLAHRSPVLRAKFERLKSELQRTLRREPEAKPRARFDATVNSKLSTLLTGCPTPEARAARALSLLMEHSHACGGFLFSVDADGARCIACSQVAPPTATLLSLVRAYLARELDQDSDTTSEGDDETLAETELWNDGTGRTYRAVMLSQSERGEMVVSGVAVLEVDINFVYPAQLASDLARYASLSVDTTFATLDPRERLTDSAR